MTFLSPSVLRSFSEELLKVAGASDSGVGVPATFGATPLPLKDTRANHGTDGRLRKIPLQGARSKQTQGPRAYAPRLAAPGT